MWLFRGSTPLEEAPVVTEPSQSAPDAATDAELSEAEIAYNEALARGTVEVHRMKIMLVGLGTAGKTSLVSALLGDRIDNEYNQTIVLQRTTVSQNADETWTEEHKAAPQLHRSLQALSSKRRLLPRLPSTASATSIASSSSASSGLLSKLPEFLRQRSVIKVVRQRTPSNIASLALDSDKVGVALELFDFAGQDRYTPLQSLFISDCAIFIVVFDLHNVWRGGDLAAQQHRAVAAWLRRIGQRTQGGQVVIVATHVDLIPDDQIDDVSDDMNTFLESVWCGDVHLHAPMMCNDDGEGDMFYTVSNLNGDGIDELRKAINSAVSNDKTFQTPQPLAWVRLGDALRDLVASDPQNAVMTTDALVELADAHNISESECRSGFLGYLERIGDAIRSSHDDCLFLDVKSVVNACAGLYRVVDAAARRPVQPPSSTADQQSLEILSQVLERLPADRREPHREALRRLHECPEEPILLSFVHDTLSSLGVRYVDEFLALLEQLGLMHTLSRQDHHDDDYRLVVIPLLLDKGLQPWQVGPWSFASGVRRCVLYWPVTIKGVERRQVLSLLLFNRLVVRLCCDIQMDDPMPRVSANGAYVSLGGLCELMLEYSEEDDWIVASLRVGTTSVDAWRQVNRTLEYLVAAASAVGQQSHWGRFDTDPVIVPFCPCSDEATGRHVLSSGAARSGVDRSNIVCRTRTLGLEEMRSLWWWWHATEAELNEEREKEVERARVARLKMEEQARALAEARKASERESERLRALEQDLMKEASVREKDLAKRVEQQEQEQRVQQEHRVGVEEEMRVQEAVGKSSQKVVIVEEAHVTLPKVVIEKEAHVTAMEEEKTVPKTTPVEAPPTTRAAHSSSESSLASTIEIGVDAGRDKDDEDKVSSDGTTEAEPQPALVRTHSELAMEADDVEDAILAAVATSVAQKKAEEARAAAAAQQETEATKALERDMIDKQASALALHISRSPVRDNDDDDVASTALSDVASVAGLAHRLQHDYDADGTPIDSKLAAYGDAWDPSHATSDKPVRGKKSKFGLFKRKDKDEKAAKKMAKAKKSKPT